MREGCIKTLLALFWTFLKISPVTFGGGYAMLPAIDREVVGKRQWLTSDEMSDMLSVAGSAPGGIGVNAAACIGFRKAGTLGAAVAVIGITLPTFLIALVMSLVYSQVKDVPRIGAMLDGVHACIIGLILVAAYKMAKSAIVDKTTLISAGCSVIILLTIPIHPMFLILFGLLLGILVVYVKKKLGMTVKLEEQAQKERTDSTFVYHDYFIADGI